MRPNLNPNSKSSAHITSEPSKNTKKTIKRLLAYLKPYKFGLFFVYLFGIISVILQAFSPRILGQVTTELYSNVFENVPVNFQVITKIIATLALVYVSSIAFLYLQNFMMTKIAGQTIYKLRKDVDEKISRLPLNYFDTKTHGEVLSTITNDIDVINSSLQQTLIQAVSSVITLISVLVMMLTISPTLTLITFLILPISMFASKGILKKSQSLFKGQQQVISELNGHIEEMYTGHDVVKLFNREDENIEKLDEMNEKWFNYSWKAQFYSSLMMPLMQFVGNIGYVVIVILGSIGKINGQITVGEIQAFIQYVRKFNEPIMQVANISNIFQSIIASSERVFAILDEPEQTEDKHSPEEFENIQGNVEFKNISFGYNKDEMLINNLSFTANSGQKIAIVGPTGAGKTTIINLLLRFYDISSGDILIDGKSIFEMNRLSLRNTFGMVLQDTWLFKGSIFDNIKYGNENATDEEVKNAAKAAYAHHFIKTLPDGYNFQLNEEASNVSSGQKQLLTIARAILSNPNILILDEATSNVDTRTEVLIQKAMGNLMNDKTSFIIAHRLSTIKDADLILVLDNGDIIEQGNHDVLLAKNGFYASLYNSQFEE